MKEGKGFKFIFDLHFWTDGPDRQEKDKGNSQIITNLKSPTSCKSKIHVFL